MHSTPSHHTYINMHHIWPDGEELPVNPQHDYDGTYKVMLRIVKAGCHPVAIAQVVEH